MKQLSSENRENKEDHDFTSFLRNRKRIAFRLELVDHVQAFVRHCKEFVFHHLRQIWLFCGIAGDWSFAAGRALRFSLFFFAKIKKKLSASVLKNSNYEESYLESNNQTKESPDFHFPNHSWAKSCQLSNCGRFESWASKRLALRGFALERLDSGLEKWGLIVERGSFSELQWRRATSWSRISRLSWCTGGRSRGRESSTS